MNAKPNLLDEMMAAHVMGWTAKEQNSVLHWVKENGSSIPCRTWAPTRNRRQLDMCEQRIHKDDTQWREFVRTLFWNVFDSNVTIAEDHLVMCWWEMSSWELVWRIMHLRPVDRCIAMLEVVGVDYDLICEVCDEEDLEYS